MKIKTLSLIALTLMFLMPLAACTGDADSADTVKLRLAENQPDDYPTTIGDKEFARLVEEKTEGRYEIEVYSGGQLGDEVSAIEQVQLGSIDLARVNATPLTQFSDSMGVLSMPYLFEDENTKWEKLNGEVGQELLATLDGSDLVGLAFYDSGERSFYNSEHPLESPEDMKGLKIRVQQSDLAIDIVEALGASATPMEYGEVYSSIQTGVIDGAENNFPSFYTSNHYEVADYYTVNGYSGTPEVLIGSEKLWNEMSEEDQKLFREAAIESVEVQREAWAELTEESKEAVEENGNELIEIDDITPWREAVQPVYDKYEGEYGEWIDKLTE
ncbi:TRAP transporter substrate-binding protein [Halobacillus sp. Marseille-P3879]|uniref:TRAP transporter substrate-binding protein n=1 Tax=Halobacillus TaxID=45667 RepID=UPI000C7DC258|nr:TRAP transporter substrate-binding protein [Halobacillus sp. Marseille-P3879]